MLKSPELFVLYVFIIWGTALAHMTNEPVVPSISNMNGVVISFAPNGFAADTRRHTQTFFRDCPY